MEARLVCRVQTHLAASGRPSAPQAAACPSITVACNRACLQTRPAPLLASLGAALIWRLAPTKPPRRPRKTHPSRRPAAVAAAGDSRYANIRCAAAGPPGTRSQTRASDRTTAASPHARTRVGASSSGPAPTSHARMQLRPTPAVAACARSNCRRSAPSSPRRGSGGIPRLDHARHAAEVTGSPRQLTSARPDGSQGPPKCSTVGWAASRRIHTDHPSA